MTASRQLFGDGAAIARQIRERIAREVQLPASAGIAAVKFAAKIASDLAKPDGQREVPAGGTRAFLAPLPLWRLWGVGRKTLALLQPLGLQTIGDLAARDPDWLERRLPGGRQLWELSQGIDPRRVVPDRAAKSIGAEDTFDEDLGVGELLPHIHGQALRVGRRLRRARCKGRVVQLKLKLSDFSLLTRQTTLAEPTDDGQSLYRAAAELLARLQLRQRVRLTGVSAHGIAGRGGAAVPVLRARPAAPTGSTPRWIASPTASAGRPWSPPTWRRWTGRAARTSPTRPGPGLTP